MQLQLQARACLHDEFAPLEVVCDQHRHSCRPKAEVQHGWAIPQCDAQLRRLEMDVAQMLQVRLAFQLNAQLLPEAAACPIRDNQVVALQGRLRACLFWKAAHSTSCSGSKQHTSPQILS